jgi:glycerate 2-kinase
MSISNTRMNSIIAVFFSSSLSAKRIQNVIIGNNRMALQAAAQLCQQSLAYVPFMGTTSLHGEASIIGRHLIELFICQASTLVYNDHTACFFANRATFELFRDLLDKHERVCLLLGGETTVTMANNNAGQGGRCQELALAAALAMTNENNHSSLFVLAAGSDGIDGPTDAAGAFAFDGMIVNDDDQRNAHSALDRHDSYTYLNETNNGNNLLKIGHTNTNVMDIIIVLVNKK